MYAFACVYVCAPLLSLVYYFGHCFQAASHLSSCADADVTISRVVGEAEVR